MSILGCLINDSIILSLLGAFFDAGYTHEFLFHPGRAYSLKEVAQITFVIPAKAGIQESTVNRKSAWKMEMLGKITRFGEINMDHVSPGFRLSPE